MTQLQMQRAARAAGARSRTVALYRTNIFTAADLSPFVLAAVFSGLLWTLTIARIFRILA